MTPAFCSWPGNTILVKHYSAIGVMQVSGEEQQTMRLLAKSSKRFLLRFTCTVSDSGTIKQLFQGKRSFTYELLKGTMLGEF